MRNKLYCRGAAALHTAGSSVVSLSQSLSPSLSLSLRRCGVEAGQDDSRETAEQGY